jgi:hypothetical protein
MSGLIEKKILRNSSMEPSKKVNVVNIIISKEFENEVNE